jgi:ligand-binding sensor protein
MKNKDVKTFAKRIMEFMDDEIKKSYLSKWIELGKKLNENDDEIDYDDENFSDSFIDDEGFDDDFDLNREFKKSQSKHSYDEVLEIIKSYFLLRYEKYFW